MENRRRAASGGRILQDVRSDEGFALIRNWLDNCRKNHPTCNDESKGAAPLRLLYVGSENTSPRLVDNQRSQYRDYIFLSYCGGAKRSLLLVSLYVDEFHQAIEFAELPRLFQDAILLARGISIDYIWVDSLCIIQDSQEDWQHATSQMIDILKGATFTVAAVNASSPHTSLFDRAGRRSQQHYPASQNFWRETWRTRAWTFQEEVLSTRF